MEAVTFAVGRRGGFGVVDARAVPGTDFQVCIATADVRAARAEKAGVTNALRGDWIARTVARALFTGDVFVETVSGE